MDLAQWQRVTQTVRPGSTVWTVQISSTWFGSPDWGHLRDDVDLALFRIALRFPRDGYHFRRLLLYDLASDHGGSEGGYEDANGELQSWLARVRRQLALIGAEGSAEGPTPKNCLYRVRLLILPRIGRPSSIAGPDGIWVNTEPPQQVLLAWNLPGLIPLDPHEENIIGPFEDRNPLWAGLST